MISISKLGMIYTNLNRPVLHVWLEYSWFVVSLLFPYTIQGLRRLIWSFLGSNWRSGVICLVQLSSILMAGVTRTLWHWPMRLVLINTSEWALFGMVWARANDLRSGVKFNKWIESLDSSSSIQAILRLIWYFWSEIGGILRSWGHFVLFLLGRELHDFRNTLESPPKRVFPLWTLRTLSASLMSSWMKKWIHQCPFWSNARIWLLYRECFWGRCLSSIRVPCCN